MKELPTMLPECLVLLSLLFFSCANKEKSLTNEKAPIQDSILSPQFQKILDDAGVKGSILIYNLDKETYYSNDFEWANTGKLPASTFKIPNSIIALETGIVENDSIVFEWDGQQRALPLWEKDLSFKEAFQLSCVPCYQEVARNIGAERMNSHLDEFGYGAMKVDATNIDMFWLEGESAISQFQQIDFLERFYKKQLPISSRTILILQEIMVMEANVKYTLRGKTGWSISNNINNGWFVGYLETREDIFFFAANVEPKKSFDRDRFIALRKDVVYDAFKQLSILD